MRGVEVEMIHRMGEENGNYRDQRCHNEVDRRQRPANRCSVS